MANTGPVFEVFHLRLSSVFAFDGNLPDLNVAGRVVVEVDASLCPVI